jgi:hypothetical protein
VRSMHEAERYLFERAVDIILLDLGLPRRRELNGRQPNCRTSPLARRLSLAAASESWPNAAF